VSRWRWLKNYISAGFEDASHSIFTKTFGFGNNIVNGIIIEIHQIIDCIDAMQLGGLADFFNTDFTTILGYNNFSVGR